jgi:subtilase family serine protease
MAPKKKRIAKKKQARSTTLRPPKKPAKAKAKKKSHVRAYGGATVEFEVALKAGHGEASIFSDDAIATTSNLDIYRRGRDVSVAAARKLQANGVEVKHLGDFSISAACSPGHFESLFGTKISEIKLPKGTQAPAGYKMLAPAAGTPWRVPATDGLDALIERAYIQQPPIPFAGERPVPPFWNDKFRLRVDTDIAQLMNASSVHRAGITGNGVRVAMPDSGFYYHPYFQAQGYNFLGVAAPDTVDPSSDASGHGTGECANLFATAPDINFIGVKMGNTTLAFKTAVELRPDVMTNSWGYNLDRPGTSMPNFLKPLYLVVLDAVAKGITVCFSAGNGHFGFPGSMPEVISVGGVHVDANLNYSATPYASGFNSTWFPGRRTPDVCGLVGIPPTADYIVLPVEAGSNLERQGGWGAFSGTSAASPMVAGVCALLKESDPSLNPDQIKKLLMYTAFDIINGVNAHGNAAGPGPDGATGFGLVDASRAVDAVL